MSPEPEAFEGGVEAQAAEHPLIEEHTQNDIGIPNMI